MKDYPIILEKKELICDNTLAFTFYDESKNYRFDAGQYAHFTLIEPEYHDEKGHSRALSFANAPDDTGKLVIAARINSSVFINNLRVLKPGSKLFVSKSSGGMKLHNDSSVPAVFISGGIGITPVRSIIENAVNKNLPHEIILFYANKKANQTAFLNDFLKWQNEYKNLKLISVIADVENKNWKYEFGTIDEKLLNKYLADLTNKIYYITGPSEMVNSVRDILVKQNIDTENIRTEKFK